LAQSVDNETWKRYDYGLRENLAIYGTHEPPLVPIENLLLPVAVFSGSYDKLADPTDVATLVQQLGSNVVFNKQYPLGHLSFALAKDMSWFSGDVVSVIDQYATNAFETSFLQ
jgi:lysosomal acid lipase/cholesteryl ester hydrolase